MKDFLLFAGENYYALVGFNDYKGKFETLELAKSEVEFNSTMKDWDWWHIVDSLTMMIVAKSEVQAYGNN